MENSIIDLFSPMLTNETYGKNTNLIDTPEFLSLRSIEINEFYKKPIHHITVRDSNFFNNNELYIRQFNGSYSKAICHNYSHMLKTKDVINILYFNCVNYFKNKINNLLDLWKVDCVNIKYAVEGMGFSIICERIDKFAKVLIKTDLEYRERYEKEFLPRYIKVKEAERSIEKHYAKLNKKAIKESPDEQGCNECTSKSI